ncbi:ABC transporter ATP-binding protein [Paenibacillus segetis]|uniref:ABC transporter ATP-binding protein YfiB n=1 Tax=Paenibacillus segetis TaxID=1325360 RepID=A0ABQ1YT29_9BACL|nr:ABC transporter ATP-binding protein [Paenibacillus segetis]GGH37818.1 putative ABC transporter ATP-binding protein YfiB [Paenibacillus segetis]
MAMILTFLKKYRIAAISALCMMLIELSVELLQPLLISKIIDHGIREENLSVVWLWGGVLVGSAILAFGAGIASSFFASHASQGFGYDLRDKLYDKVQSFTYSVFNRFETSSLITRLTGDITQLQDMVFMSLRFATRVPLVVFGSMIMALYVNVKLGLLLTVTVPLLFIFVILMMKLASRLFKKVQQRVDTVNGVIQENLTGMRLIRVFVRMSHEIKRFEKHSKELMKATVSAIRLTETMMPFVLLMMNAGVIAILWFGRKDIGTGQATMGEVVAILNYTLRTLGALSSLSWIMTSYSRASASKDRVQEVFMMQDTDTDTIQVDKHSDHGLDMGNRHAAIAGKVEFEGVGFRYPESDISVLDDISFTALPGQRIAIMGATGSGKSSLIRLIPRLYDPTSGIIRIDGTDICEIPSSQLRNAIGYVPQEVMLFTGSIRENIAWGREDASLEEIQEAAKRAQIHDTIESLTHGYDTMLGQRGVNLSGGQKQRLSIARALIRQPSILILDDCTSALDVRTEAALLEALTELSCTTFLITQKISSTTAADHILLLDEGCLLTSGKHEELLVRSTLYRKIYESQYGKEAEASNVQDLL